MLAGLGLLAVIGVGLIGYGATRHSSPAAAPLPPATSASTSTAPTVPSASASRMDAPLPTAATTPTVSPTPQRQVGLAATSIRIPALEVTASIGAATVTDGVLTPPRIPDVVGLWAGSAPLSASTGEVTIAGHVNWAGMAPFAFARLAYLHPGDLVYTTDAAGAQAAWRVQTVVARPKSQPIDAAAFAGKSGPRTLSLITCGGAYDSGSASYEDNVYVTATPAT